MWPHEFAVILLSGEAGVIRPISVGVAYFLCPDGNYPRTLEFTPHKLPLPFDGPSQPHPGGAN